jgi:serine/threonine-protein kinase
MPEITAVSPQTIAHYRITVKLGEGGMGEVWRATDTKLNRDVAIKILPDAFAQDAERMARFEREAKVLASLNHPNIAAIYGVEERALIMELVEGETLHGLQPLETALNYARQIAEALEYSHERGIVHRDLKPANIKVTPEGRVKVLDFGLAKAMSNETAAGNPESSPTLTMRASMAGVILGTAAYMSPEQARGKQVDKRADIWAFGVVLYEMLTSEQLFQGETVSDVLAAVLTREPDWNRAPVKVRRLLQRCLEKDPKRRLRDIGDALLLLDEGAPLPPVQVKSRLPWVAAGLFALAAVMALWSPWHAKPLQPLVRLDVDLGSDVSFDSIRGPDVIISPDGTRLVYCSQSRLFTRRLDQEKATPLPGTEGAYSPFFSPDGQWVAFYTPVSLKKVSVQGGSAVPVCNASWGAGGSWGDDGNIVAALSRMGPISRVPATGGTPVPVVEPAPGDVSIRWPQILPGAKALLFTALTSTMGLEGSIKVMSLSDRRQTILQQRGIYGRYLPSGHLTYVINGTLFAVLFDVGRREMVGTPVPVLEKVEYSGRNGSAQLDFSQTGTLLYRRGEAAVNTVNVQWLDRAGEVQPFLPKTEEYATPRLSPDGKRLALSLADDIWIYEPQRETMTRLTRMGVANFPVWTPDGRYIIFGGRGGLYWTHSDGSAEPQALTESGTIQIPYSFTGDGRRLAFLGGSRERGAGIWTVPLERGEAGLRAGTPEPFRTASFTVTEPHFSPDGRWLAYCSNESGREQVYVQAFPEKGSKQQISNGGGAYPVFSPNGRELFFRTPENQIMVASYTVAGGSFLVGKPRLWSEKHLANVGLFSSYDIAPDGQRILALMPVDTPEAQRSRRDVSVLLNFFEELQRRVPVR